VDVDPVEALLPELVFEPLLELLEGGVGVLRPGREPDQVADVVEHPPGRLGLDDDGRLRRVGGGRAGEEHRARGGADQGAGDHRRIREWARGDNHKDTKDTKEVKKSELNSDSLSSSSFVSFVPLWFIFLCGSSSLLLEL